MARRPRHLSKEDRRLWDSVASTIRPRSARDELAGVLNSSTSLPPEPSAEPDASEALPPSTRPPRFRIGERSAAPPPGHDLAASLTERFAAEPLDRRTGRRLRKGGTKPQGRIDLHGMTQARAHPALVGFLLDAYRRDLRLVLVITGKGKERDEGGPLPVPVGVLRHQVPHWLGQPPLRDIVLRIAPAQRQHGGEGAYYVFLRRAR